MIFYYKAEKLSVYLKRRCLHGSISDLQDMIAISSGISKFISIRFFIRAIFFDTST